MVTPLTLCPPSPFFKNWDLLSIAFCYAEKDIENRTNIIHVKKFSALLIRAQQASTLLQLLESPTTTDDEKNFGQVIRQTLKKADGSKKRVRTHSVSIVELLPPTMSVLKQRCLTLLGNLEAAGIVKKSNGYEVRDGLLFFLSLRVLANCLP